jgi:uncharacterized Zn-finger protein
MRVHTCDKPYKCDMPTGSEPLTCLLHGTEPHSVYPSTKTTSPDTTHFPEQDSFPLLLQSNDVHPTSISSEPVTCLLHGNDPHSVSPSTKTESPDTNDFPEHELFPLLLQANDVHPTSTTSIAGSILGEADTHSFGCSEQLTYTVEGNADQTHICDAANAMDSMKLDTCKLHTDTHVVDDIKSHTGDKPFKCGRCMKSFSRKETLVTHIRLHTGDKLYKCDTCKKSFTHKSHCVEHMRVHTGDKPYECAKCMKSFSRNSRLMNHIRQTHGDTPYKCDRCIQSFDQKSALVTHMREHTCDKLYKYDRCLKSFANRGHFVQHMRVQHWCQTFQL